MTHTAIFDIDGTLIDSMSIDTPLYFSAIREVVGDVGIRDLHACKHVTDTGILAEILRDNGRDLDLDIITAVRTAFVNGLREHIREAGGFPVIAGAREFFCSIRKSGDTRVAVATGGWRDSALLKLESAGFDIDGIPLFTSDDAISRTEIMRLALEATGGDAGSVTYFGDALDGIRSYSELDWQAQIQGNC